MDEEERAKERAEAEAAAEALSALAAKAEEQTARIERAIEEREKGRAARAKERAAREKVRAQREAAADALEAETAEVKELRARLERATEEPEAEEGGEEEGQGPAKKSKTTGSGGKRKMVTDGRRGRPVDEVSSFFNGLVFFRGKKDSLEKKTEEGDGDGSEKLTDEELNKVAYPFPTITLTRDDDGLFWGDGEEEGYSDVVDDGIEHTFQAPNGKYFTARDLADAMAEFEPDDDVDDLFFEGLAKVGRNKYWVMWGS